MPGFKEYRDRWKPTLLLGTLALEKRMSGWRRFSEKLLSRLLLAEIQSSRIRIPGEPPLDEQCPQNSSRASEERAPGRRNNPQLPASAMLPAPELPAMLPVPALPPEPALPPVPAPALPPAPAAVPPAPAPALPPALLPAEPPAAVVPPALLPAEPPAAVVPPAPPEPALPPSSPLSSPQAYDAARASALISNKPL